VASAFFELHVSAFRLHSRARSPGTVGAKLR
jgi:hypothetical protein